MKLTLDGKVKVLDFGLAKAYAGDAGLGGVASDFTQSPTLAQSGTAAGVILGTASYMSPEQASGKPVDKRADIWAFGVVLFEMLTGRMLFTGETASEVLASVIKDEPDWTSLPSASPPGLLKLLRRCLEKNPRRRLHDIADARIEIEETVTEPMAPVSIPIEAPKPRRRAQALPWKILAGLTTIIAAVSLWSLWREGTPPQSVTRFAVHLPPGQTIYRHWHTGSSVGLSPDGTQIVYVGQQGETRLLYSRGMDAFEGRPIPGTEGAVNPFFSPDGKRVGFFADRKLKKVFLQGGTPIAICDTPAGVFCGGSWGADDIIYFGTWLQTRLWRVPAGGGTPEPVTPAEELLKLPGQEERLWPQNLPGGKAILYTVWHNFMDMRVALYSLESDRQRILIDKGTHAQYVPTGHLVYAWAGDLLAAPFSLSELELTGPSVPVLEGVATGDEGGAHFGVSETGSLIYVPGGPYRQPEHAGLG